MIRISTLFVLANFDISYMHLDFLARPALMENITSDTSEDALFDNEVMPNDNLDNLKNPSKNSKVKLESQIFIVTETLADSASSFVIRKR